LPNKEQEDLMNQHVGASRWVYNYFLDVQINRHKAGEKYLLAYGMSNLLTEVKREPDKAWLNEISRATLNIRLSDLDQAYRRFFKEKKGFPKFKSKKRTKPSFPIRPSVYFQNDIASIEKIGKVRYKTNYSLPQGKGNKFVNPRMAFVNNKWILTVAVEVERQEQLLTDKAMGVDLGIKDFAVVSCGGSKTVFHNINKSRRVKCLNGKLKHLQRSVSRKYRVHGNYHKYRNIMELEDSIRKVYYRLSNIRRNYIHQVTHKLVSMLPFRITVEDLNVRGMMKNRHLSRAIQEQNFAEFLRQIEYKSAWNGIELVKADRFYPSSKTCSGCGSIKKDLKLTDRTYVCLVCGLVIDRDYNAAINLERYDDQYERLSA
jgi:putative transposase